MGLDPARGHHRRRSSVLAGAGPSSQISSGPGEQREDGQREDQKPLNLEEPDCSDLSSIAESVEMDYMSSDNDLHDDEETGLTAKQRRQRQRRRRKQRRQLDARIADVKTSQHNPYGLGVADRTVMKRLLANACLIGLWYFFSLAISIYNKWMFSDRANEEEKVVFPFPLFTTSLHMVVQFLLSSCILWLFPSLRPRSSSLSTAAHGSSDEPRPVVTKMFYFTRLVPCGVATSLDIGLGNMSLRFISLTFLTMCKSSALAFVLLFAFVFRLEAPSLKLIIIIATMTIGVIMMVAGETAFNAVGFALVIASAFFSGFRWGLTQILLLRHPATSNPFSTLFFLNPVMFLSLIVIALTVEGPVEIAQGFRALAESHGISHAILLLVFPGLLAFCMISSEFALLKRSSVVTLSICGIFKEVVTISAAGVVFHDRLTTVNVTGLVVTIGSIASYNYMKISKMRSEAKEDALDRSPNPGSDSDDFSPVQDGRGEYRGLLNSEEGATNPSRDSRNTSPSEGVSGGRNSFRVRTSGASSGVQSLSIPTPGIGEQDRQISPRIVSASPLKHTFGGPDHDRSLRPIERGSSPGSHSASSVSPERHA
ncbi:hypothetical protein ASPZODRAFT_144055 [Penicilliopsis zonata CBS 506.65]|uniref:Sugar phosphate transporter domain-containing protein n=1 Tax=Penicilliopsis zonata CBS 506.65 TaxID=1073090 RepID=A0A1L9SEE9_9EURO|nr:hypothetical protein ASPZODRAFT_144055 [Penicilliopsis zonata CBS 506.65]OJJ45424.1 hypothetical protein ASPZODRAFT_144055 [Penicilliopsis zonata CBS 506.65]